MAVSQNQDPNQLYQATAGDQVVTPTNTPAPTGNPNPMFTTDANGMKQWDPGSTANVSYPGLAIIKAMEDAWYSHTPLSHEYVNSTAKKGNIGMSGQFALPTNLTPPTTPNTQFPTNPNPPVNTTQPVPGSPAPVNPNPNPRGYTGTDIGSTAPMPQTQFPPEIHQSLQTIQNFLSANPHMMQSLLGSISPQTLQNNIAGFAPQPQATNTKQKQKPQGALDLLRSIYSRGDTSNPTTQVR